ncbi:MAG: dehydrogenase component [Ignavibacteria bacterium]|nr:dehydrogenase component [Ignavibacteria bacterium]
MPNDHTKSKTYISIGKILNQIPGIIKMTYQGKEREIILNCPFDTRNVDNETVIDWYSQIHLGRTLDDKAALYVKMAKGWTYHAPFGGHDGIQFALGKIFRQGKDFLFPYYRDMLTCLIAGITVDEIILNGLSKEDDIAGGGRHMSNHFAKQSLNIQNVSSCTGNHAQHAAGLARAVKKYGGDEVVYYSGGESASSEGYFWEALNCATLEKLPVIFVIQNNRYAISVPLVQQTANILVSENYSGFKNLKIFNCNGRCPFNSFKTLSAAKRYVESGAGPAIVHADCDRMGAHSNSDPHKLYRSDDELDDAAKRDPMLQLRYIIVKNGIAKEEELIAIEEKNRKTVYEAADRIEKAPNADGSQWNKFIVPEQFAKEYKEPAPKEGTPQVTYLHAINSALKEEFRRNPNTFLWGQDVASKDKGGVFNVTKGMAQEFGDERVFNSPIAENNIVGTANGFSRYRKDIWVVVEGAEFADYFWPAMDQLIECSHDYWRTKGQFAPNVVIRLASGGYIQGGLYHSQNLEGVFTTIPGIRVVSPAFADDAIGLMRNAMRSQGVTVYLEPKFLYNYKNASTIEPNEDFILPFGKAKVRRTGTDISIITYGTACHLSLIAAEELNKEGISVEVVDLRSLNPLDEETILASVEKTNRVVVAHEDKMMGGFGGEIVALITEKAFGKLDAPVMRACSKFSPVGFAKEYEKEILLNTEDIKKTVRKVVSF